MNTGILVNFRLLGYGPELLLLHAVIMSKIMNSLGRDDFYKLFFPNSNHPCRVEQNIVAACEDGRKTVS